MSCRIWRGVCLVAIAAVPSVSLSQRPAVPGWMTRADGAAPLEFVRMPPGWHITTGAAGAILYDVQREVAGRYAVESEQILFPGASQSGFGLLLGGAGLERADASYMAFLIRRDGHASVEHRQGSERHTVVEWTPAPSVVRVTGDETASNRLRVEVDADSVRFTVNAVRAVTLPRGTLPLDGRIGFRVGPEVNMHITTLDVLQRLAPPRAPRSSQ